MYIWTAWLVTPLFKFWIFSFLDVAVTMLNTNVTIMPLRVVIEFQFASSTFRANAVLPAVFSITVRLHKHIVEPGVLSKCPIRLTLYMSLL